MTVQTKDSARYLADMAMESAAVQVAAGTQVMSAVYMLRADGEILCVQLPWEDDAQKAHMLGAARRTCSHPDLIAYALVVEAWAVHQKVMDVDPATIRPSTHPERVEVVMVTAQAKGEPVLSVKAEIERKGRESKLVKTEYQRDGVDGFHASGAMVGWLNDVSKKETRH